ncbi:MAG TPA: hypothetical protein VMR18_01235 [Candidatus Saccharimonadales bacterium]|nr:hypothetical protein [Candidatus Saccharimonadales bacterium]
MDSIVINSSTNQELVSFIEKPSQAIGIVGVNGSGKRTLVQWLTSKLLQINFDKVTTYPYYLDISPVNDSISIEEIRNTQKFLKLKTPEDDRLIRRVAVIEHAEVMTREAQNALLKQLEEPPNDTVFILTLDNVHGILPTVLSRLTTINIHKPSKTQIISFFSAMKNSESDINKAYLLSGGLIGSMSSFLTEGETEKTEITIGEVKELLVMSKLDRLLSIDKLYVKKDDLKQFIQMLIQMSQGTIIQTASKNDNQSLSKWKRILSLAYDAKVALQKNAQPKLVLMDLLINL